MQIPEIDLPEVARLRQITRDLVAISTLPAIWGGLQPEGVIKSLSSVLLNTLDLELVYIRLANSDAGDAIEALCGKGHAAAEPFLPQVREALDPFLIHLDADQLATIPDPFGSDTLRVNVIRFGLAKDNSVVAAASRRADFPSERDRLLLSVGANQAVVVVQRQHAERALRLSEEKYRTLFTEMAQSNKHLSEFLAVLAHELRNPLAPILTGLEMMRMRSDSPETVIRVRDMIERQANQMVHLMNDLLDIARVTNGKIELKKKPVDLNSIIPGAVEASLSTIEAAQHELSMKLGDESLWLNADSARITQVISNLLTNAAKYTPRGGKINLIVKQEGDEAIVSISDNGIGIPSESLSSVFGMFSQVRRNIEHSQGGLGIGLALVRNLISLHDGTVVATSEGVGKGSTFIVRLPIDRANQQCNKETESSIQIDVAHKKFRILVADDNIDAAQSLASLLKIYGHDVQIAHDGRQALQIANEFQPEIAFLDIGMPGMTGYEVTRHLRNIDSLKRLKIVAVSGWGTEEDRARAKNAGFDNHFTKPLSPAIISKLIAELQ